MTTRRSRIVEVDGWGSKRNAWFFVTKQLTTISSFDINNFKNPQLYATFIECRWCCNQESSCRLSQGDRTADAVTLPVMVWQNAAYTWCRDRAMTNNDAFPWRGQSPDRPYALCFPRFKFKSEGFTRASSFIMPKAARVRRGTPLATTAGPTHLEAENITPKGEGFSETDHESVNTAAASKCWRCGRR
jgi:hypothetical protein